jgi:hypothetical protein
LYAQIRGASAAASVAMAIARSAASTVRAPSSEKIAALARRT